MGRDRQTHFMEEAKAHTPLLKPQKPVSSTKSIAWTYTEETRGDIYVKKNNNKQK